MGHIIDWLVQLPAAIVLVAVFLVPLPESSAFVGFIFPGEIAILIGGVLANEGALPLWSVIVLGAARAIIGTASATRSVGTMANVCSPDSPNGS